MAQHGDTTVAVPADVKEYITFAVEAAIQRHSETIRKDRYQDIERALKTQVELCDEKRKAVHSDGNVLPLSARSKIWGAVILGAFGLLCALASEMLKYIIKHMADMATGGRL